MSMLVQRWNSCLVPGELLDGNIISMALQEAYTDIRSQNVMNPECSHKMLKKLLRKEISDTEFHQPQHVNEPEHVSIKCVRDAAMQLVEDEAQHDIDVNCLFTPAKKSNQQSHTLDIFWITH